MAITEIDYFGELPLTLDFHHLKTDHLSKVVFACTIVFICAYSKFFKIIESFIKSFDIPKLNQGRFIEALWTASLCLSCLPLFGSHLISHVHKDQTRGSIVNAVIVAVTSSALNVTDQTETTVVYDKEITLCCLYSYILPMAFSCHQFIHRLFSSEGLQSSPFIPLLIHSAYSLQCLEVGMQAVFQIALAMGAKEVARATAALASRKRGSDSHPPPVLLQISAAIFFYIHLIVWSMIHMYLMPVLMHSMPSLLEVEPMQRTYAAFLNISILSYMIIEFVHSPVWCALHYGSLYSSQDMRTLMLSLPAVVLLPYSSELLTDLHKIKIYLEEVHAVSRSKQRAKRFISGQQQSVESTPPQEPTADMKEAKNKLISNQNSSVDAAASFLSVVKCVMAMKKKMRHRKELRANAATSDCEFLGYIDSPTVSPSSSQKSLPLQTSASLPSSSKARGVDPIVGEKNYLENAVAVNDQDALDNSVDEVIDTFISVPVLNSYNGDDNSDEK